MLLPVLPCCSPAASVAEGSSGANTEPSRRQQRLGMRWRRQSLRKEWPWQRLRPGRFSQEHMIALSGQEETHAPAPHLRCKREGGEKDQTTDHLVWTPIQQPSFMEVHTVGENGPRSWRTAQQWENSPSTKEADDAAHRIASMYHPNFLKSESPALAQKEPPKTLDDKIRCLDAIRTDNEGNAYAASKRSAQEQERAVFASLHHVKRCSNVWADQLTYLDFTGFDMHRRILVVDDFTPSWILLPGLRMSSRRTRPPKGSPSLGRLAPLWPGGTPGTPSKTSSHAGWLDCCSLGGMLKVWVFLHHCQETWGGFS